MAWGRGGAVVSHGDGDWTLTLWLGDRRDEVLQSWGNDGGHPDGLRRR